jgi:neurotransmitter:Na+ symporter, NSS family
MADQRGSFSRIGFVVAAAGSAIGLGNIWKFPYITYANEGGSFVLVYLAAVLLIGAPIMLAEIVIGRRSGKSPVGAFLELSRNVAGGRAWAAVGVLGVAAGFVILSFYSVVAGWTLYYFGRCVAWSLTGFTPEIAAGLGADFGAFLGNPALQVAFHGAFMTATMAVVVLGVQKGIERVTKVLTPLLFGILLLLAIASAWSAGFQEAMRFLFHVGPIDRNGVLEAIGHSFFTLSLGMGAMITYGSYMGRGASIRRNTLVVCTLDTLIALMACIVMFSIIFNVPEAERTESFGRSAVILFTTLPRMFYELPLGAVLAPTFYALIALAALTSTISLLEVVVSYFIDQRGWARRRATLAVGGAIFGSGILAALSLGAVPALSAWAPLGERHAGVFGVADYLASNWMLPVGGLLIAVFAGWFLSGRDTREELEAGHGPFALHGVWKLLVGVLCPVAIAWIIVAVLRGATF